MSDSSDWKSTASRQTILNSMEAMLRRAGKVDESIYAKLPEFESKIFNESSSQEIYRQHLSKLINHLNNPGARQVQQQQQAAMQQQQQAMGMQPQSQQQASMQQQQSQQAMGMHQQSQQPMGMQQPPQQPIGMQQPPQQPMSLQQQQPPMGVPPHMGMRQPQPMGHNQSMMPMTSQQQTAGPPMPAVPQPAPVLTQQMMSGSQHVPAASQQQRMVSHAVSAGDPLPTEQGYASSPAATGQVPQLSSRMAYSPSSSGLPMPSPNARMMRVPQPSPSMTMSINTPNPSVMTPQETTMASPASYNPMSQQAQQQQPSTDEEQIYLDKMRELSVYREPLKKMISDMGKDNRTQQVEYKKLCALLSVLEPTVNQKTSYEMLCKYEDVLKKLVPKLKTPKEGIHWCQPFLTAVAESMKSTMGKSALRQTFGPAVHTLYGPDLSSSPSIPTSRKRKLPPASQSQSDVPHIVQGELARLNRKFKVSRDLDGVDSADPYRTNVLRLQCCLEEKGLPSVPPLKFTILPDYPVTNPQWNKTMKFYDDSDFLLDVKKRTTNGLLKLQNKFSMTAMLETWSGSVRQACVGLS